MLELTLGRLLSTMPLGRNFFSDARISSASSQHSFNTSRTAQNSSFENLSGWMSVVVLGASELNQYFRLYRN